MSDRTWRFAGRISQNRADLFWPAATGWFFFFVTPVLLGLVMREIFDAVEDPDSGARPYLFLAVLVVIELVRRLVVHWSAIGWVRAWTMMEAVPQANMLESQVVGGGAQAGPLVDRPGEAVSVFRDDPRDVAWFVDSWIDVTGAAAYGVLAGIVMFLIDPLMAFVVVLPMVAVAVLVRMLGGMVKQAHRADLDAASRVSGILRDLFQAAPVVAVHGAIDPAVAEVERRSEVRRGTAVRNRVLDESIAAVSWSSGDVAVGLVLLVAAGSMRSGEFSVGDLALFLVYLDYLTFLPRMIGLVITRHRQADAAFDRMEALVGGGRATVARPRAVWFDRPERSPSSPEVAARRPLRTLEVRGLTATFDGGRGVPPVDLEIQRGTLTVVSGPIGTGKTTLLRALTGLLPSEGSVLWNGEEIDDLGAFMVPPHSAYLPQVPALFSDTLAENVRLAALVSDEEVSTALETSAMSADLATMPRGLDTIVGARGLRLSGGQRQRLAAARAMVRRSELLVIDDLSSAVDVETEVELWDRLRHGGRTVLAVSNRPVALRRADQVLELLPNS